VIPILDLFEAHLTVSNLERAIHFYQDQLGVELAHMVPDRRVAFFWLGARGKSMLGLWETGAIPLRMNGHVAFQVELSDLLQAPARLKEANITPRDFGGSPTEEPIVLAWMPAAAVYFLDQDGNQLEFITMLPDTPRPELGIVPWRDWPARC
jgi:lactoylglutathione lyase